MSPVVNMRIDSTTPKLEINLNVYYKNNINIKEAFGFKQLNSSSKA